MRLALTIWRQAGPDAPGRFARYPLEDLTPDMALLEALDLLNDRLANSGELPVAFDSSCREGICGACGFLVDGRPHGPRAGLTICELRLRDFADGQELVLEPFRRQAFPLVRDLMVDRSALDRVIAAGGFVSVRAGSAPDANAIPIAKADAERALDAAACIGCGACVAACPNGAASLFVGAKLAHLAALPQGQPERKRRALALASAADSESFGGCSLHGECQAVCPKRIGLDVVARLNREVLRALR